METIAIKFLNFLLEYYNAIALTCTTSKVLRLKPEFVGMLGGLLTMIFKLCNSCQKAS